METRYADDFVIEAVDLGDIDSLEEEITPCTGCGCECTYEKTE